MKGVKIEKLEKFDRDTLERLVEIYMDGYEGLREYGGEGVDYARGYLRWCWVKAKDGFFVAKVGGEIVGFIVCDRDWHSKYEERSVGAVHEFVIDSRFQGKGIGRALMDTCLRYLEESYDRIELWVGEKNEGAKHFYEEYGFRVVGKERIWRRMVLDLKKNEKNDKAKSRNTDGD
ncbi:GNAT family N-acetyltransferase [Thermococcus sp. Bubb.Bath]|uniref:GNAT family N-acetyltransferase n=1 Tax=Thermococcus sp. Bubb.Bath TaxID=1638242 RepID=UPI00143B5A41|nr:GNAT family N-acetyltransferase [Thermococcus sp. Bubb.Bath]NJF25450.1 GNAT family N-acetyltransferase [Thermococcus sp. Bubb.Bath]